MAVGGRIPASVSALVGRGGRFAPLDASSAVRGPRAQFSGGDGDGAWMAGGQKARARPHQGWSEQGGTGSGSVRFEAIGNGW